MYENNRLNVIKIKKEIKAIEQVKKYAKKYFLLIINALGFLCKNQKNQQYIYSQKANIYC